MRITAGSFRGRSIHIPGIAGLRPTPAKVRQALFNILGDVTGWSILDLFSGSGLMALESLSRGAEQAVSIEQHHKAFELLQKVRHEWGLLERWQIMRGSLPAMLGKLEGQHFDLVFADPPYEKQVAEQVPAWLSRQDISCRHLIVEESARMRPCWPAGWTAMQSRRYGDTCLYFLAMEEK